MKSERNIGKSLMCAGAILLAAAIVLTAYNILDQNRAQISVEESLSAVEQMIPETPVDSQFDKPLYELNPDMEMPVATVEGIDYIGTLYIEQLNLKFPVIAECSYQNLKKAPCCYSGSVYKDNMVIAAHNYQRHFAALKNIETGTIVVFMDMEGNVFEYKAVVTEVLQPSAVSEMVSGEYDLTLFTCTIGGRTRLTVRCEKI